MVVCGIIFEILLLIKTVVVNYTLVVGWGQLGSILIRLKPGNKFFVECCGRLIIVNFAYGKVIIEAVISKKNMEMLKNQILCFIGKLNKTTTRLIECLFCSGLYLECDFSFSFCTSVRSK